VAQKDQDTKPAKDMAPKPRSASKKEAVPKKEAAPKRDTGAKKVSSPTQKVAPTTEAAAPAEAPEPRTAADAPEENPVHRKLGLRPGIIGLVVAPPADADNPLSPLPDGFSVVPEADAVSSFEGQVDYLHFFARNRGELARVLGSLRDKLAPGGSLWISWIKQSSSRRGEGLPGDLNENVIRRLALTTGLVDVKVAALDQDWSALKLVRRRR
jgi:hypothetical protein